MYPPRLAAVKSGWEASRLFSQERLIQRTCPNWLSVSLLFGFIQISLNNSTFAFRAVWRNLSFLPSFLPSVPPVLAVFALRFIPTVCHSPAYLHSSAPLLQPPTVFLFPPESPFCQRPSRCLTTANLLPVARRSKINNFLNRQMGVRLISIFCCLITRMKCISVKRWYGCLGESSVSPPLTSISNQYLQFARQ